MPNTPAKSSQVFVEKFDNFPLAKKLALGFGVVVTLMVMMAASNYFFTERLASIEATIAQKLVPIEVAELELKGSMNESLAALRGYMLLGDNKFKGQRKQSWDSINKQVKLIEANIDYLSEPSKSAFSDLKIILKEFSIAQKKVESIANTDAEQPATRVLLEEAAPRAKKILSSVTNIINEEKQLEANSERKALLGLLADSRGSFAVGLASIRAYLLSGDEAWRDDFLTRWKVNEARFQSLKENAYLFNAKQHAEFNTYSRNRQAFSTLPEKMFSIRSSRKWNMANYLLATEAAPRAKKALDKIDIIYQDSAKVIHEYEQDLSSEKTLSELFSLALAAIAIVVAILSAKFITARITSSINKIKESLEDIERGEFGCKIEVTSSDEIGSALLTLEKTRVQLQDIIEKDVKSMIDSARKGDLSNRIVVDDKTGSYRELCNGINELIEINNQVITETVDVFSALAHGNLDVQINSNYEGDFARIKKDANFTIDKLHHIIEKDVQDVINHAVSGDFSKRIVTDDKQGFFLDLSEKINLFIDSNQSLVNDVVRVFGAMSKGNLNESIQSDYRGEFAKLKEDANTTVHKLKAIIEQEVQTVVNAALEGDLSKKITEDNKQGFFKELSSSINQLTDVSGSIIEDASNVVGAIANGDLTQTIDHEYKGSFGELKGNVNNTVYHLKDVIENIHNAAESVNTGSSELAIGVNDLSERTEQQAASLEETAASMEQMTSSVQQSSTNAKEATDMTVVAEQCAVSGGIAVDSAVTAMKGINEASTKIANIIGVIDEIAFQTNLLALNAAVEAARAGEQGRGFAVVAGEVRTLAQRSAGAAKEIKDLIGDSVNRVENGSKLVNDSGETLKEIIDSVKQVSTAITSLSTASEQQYVGIQQVNSAVLNMDQMTQQNAALVEQSSAACEGMSGQAQKLMELVSFFNTGKISDVSGHQTIELDKQEDVVDKKTKINSIENTNNKPELKEKPVVDKVNEQAKEQLKDTDKKFQTVSAKTSDTKLLRPDIETGKNDFDMDGDWEEF